MIVMAAMAAGLLIGTGASAEVLAIKVTAVDPATMTISGANPTMASDVRMFKYRDITAGVKFADIKVGDMIEVDYSTGSTDNWLTAVTKK
jgi:hypothetical protein